MTNTNHVTPEVVEEVMKIMDVGHDLIDLIESSIKPSRARSVAITNLETALLWASAARYQEAEEAKK